MTADDSITLPTGLLAPGHARAWVAERADRIPAEFVDDVLLIASELVTNAVRHGRPEIVLSLREVPGGLRVEVGDGGAHVPVRAIGTPTVDRPTGRGLLIVAATAREWGIAPHLDGPGKTIWAELSNPEV